VIHEVNSPKNQPRLQCSSIDNVKLAQKHSLKLLVHGPTPYMLDFVVIGLLSVLQANQKGESCYIIILNTSAHSTSD